MGFPLDLLHQRHSEATGHAANTLAAGDLRIDDDPDVVRPTICGTRTIPKAVPARTPHRAPDWKTLFSSPDEVELLASRLSRLSVTCLVPGATEIGFFERPT
jgi:hypothetical protein